MQILAIDYGQKRIGLAVCDEAETMALSMGLFEWQGKAHELERLGEKIRESGAKQVVVGLPRNMDGSLGPSAERVLKFIESLKRLVDVPFVTWDERLTSEEAKKQLHGIEMTRRKKRAHLNVVSAQIILNAYLDQRRRMR